MLSNNNYSIQRGSALITALFIMTLIAIAATAMSIRMQQDIYRTQVSINSDKLYLASFAVTCWAMAYLANQNPPFTTQDPTGKLAEFPKKHQSIYPGVVTKGGLFDLQARFNLNNVQDKKFQPFFYGLMENTLKKTDALQRRLILNATINWISAYQPDRGHDELFDFYAKQKPPYFPGYQPMQNSSEFRLVSGVNAALYQSLLPLITALPEVTLININTAPIAILMPLGNGLTASQAHELLDARGEKGFADRGAVSLILTKLNIPDTQVTLESTYFLSVSTTTSQDLSLTHYTIIKRHKDKNGKLTISIINESLNTM